MMNDLCIVDSHFSIWGQFIYLARQPPIPPTSGIGVRGFTQPDERVIDYCCHERAIGLSTATILRTKESVRPHKDRIHDLWG